MQLTHQSQLESKQKELTNEPRSSQCFMNESMKSNSNEVKK